MVLVVVLVQVMPRPGAVHIRAVMPAG